jgi:chromosome segregation ATPase
MYSLEELPPPKREPPKPKGGGPVRLPGLALVTCAAITVAFLAATGFWIDHRLSRIETDLASARTGLDEAGASLRLLWTTTTRLDESQGERQDVLQDSLGFVRDYVESEVSKLWRSAYLDHQNRLEQNARRIATNGETIARLLDASSQASARIDAFSRRFAVQDADLHSLGEAVDGLRQASQSLTDQYSDIEKQIVAERAARLLVDGRLQGVEQWNAAFRGEGLSAHSLQTRLASLAADLRAATVRLDSLRLAVDSVRVGTRVGVMGATPAFLPAGRPNGS